MPKEHHTHQQSPNSEFGNTHHWSAEHHYSPHVSSPGQDFHGYFVPSGSAGPHGLSVDSGYAREPLPLYTSAPSLQGTPSLGTAQWPSMLTNPSSQPPPSAPPTMPSQPPLAPVSTFATAHSLPPLSTPTPHQTGSSRRTLTDLDRRRMCEYHEANPTVKQTEIGGKLFTTAPNIVVVLY